jgi:transposase
MNNDYFTINVLARLEEKIFPEGRTVRAKRLIVHTENFSIHTSGTTEDYMKYNMMGLRHPPHSPDLVLSDFYLLLSVKKS